MAGAGDEDLGDGGEIGEEPGGDGQAGDGVLEQGAPAQLVVEQEKAAAPAGLGEGPPPAARGEERPLQRLRGAHGHQAQGGVVARILKGEVLAAERLEDVREAVLKLLQKGGRRLRRVGQVKDGLGLHARLLRLRAKQKARAPACRATGLFAVAHRAYSATIASIGQAPAQVPQLTHFSASMT